MKRERNNKSGGECKMKEVVENRERYKRWNKVENRGRDRKCQKREGNKKEGGIEKGVKRKIAKREE